MDPKVGRKPREKARSELNDSEAKCLSSKFLFSSINKASAETPEEDLCPRLQMNLGVKVQVWESKYVKRVTGQCGEVCVLDYSSLQRLQ